MPRIRTIKPQFFTDETIAELPAIARILFIGLWTIADRSGRLADRPRRIKVEVLPYDDEDIETLLKLLAESQFIVRYEVEGAKYIQIRTFEQHQVCHPREVKSTIPGPPLTQQHLGNAKEVPNQGPAIQEGKEISVEQEGKEREVASAAEPASAAPQGSASGEPEGEVPKRTVAKRAPKTLNDDDLAELQADPAFAALNVRLCYAKCVRWCKENGKTLSRQRFINWLNREEQPLNGINQANQQTGADAEFEFRAARRL